MTNYVTTDGVLYNLQQEEGYTYCDNAHPMRDGSYHEGGEEHLYHFWQLSVWEPESGTWRKVDAADRKKDLRAHMTSARTLRGPAGVDRQIARLEQTAGRA